ncbi:alanine racemase [Desulfobacter postgatei]|uniref:Alanine racemase n=1 Tax=Desulfobacter postgatei 2ac9 TaxID=879212 RepID=I5AYB8_9BACT|nr:alanine racemase [Desulfobacter postgatei]EIM62231.1 alanine racemase [Desulfobacter postgatei 2ac9]
MNTPKAGLLEPQSRVQVDLSAFGQNVRTLKSLTPTGTRFCAVVKANAYGHGGIQCAKTALENGSHFLAVVRISEAVAMRDAGITAPILLLGDALPEQVSFLATHGIRASVADIQTARALSAAAQALNTTLKIHIKLDTGMGRLGFLHPDVVIKESGQAAGIGQAREIAGLKGMEVEGTYTHFAKADMIDKTHVKGQLARFNDMVAMLADMGIHPEIRHAANSAALLELPEAHFDMVRPGIAMYGMAPSGEVDITGHKLVPIMSITAKVIYVKAVPKDFSISYGSTHVTAAPTVIATVPIGYADGYSRLLSNQGQMLIKGQKAPIVGRVTMDFTMIDVGHIPGIKPGDDVTILGTQANERITADDIAGLTGTINYEVTAGLTGRMPVSYV